MSFSRCVASRRLLGWGLALTILLFASIAHAEGKNLRVVTDNSYPPYVFQGPYGMSLGGNPEPGHKYAQPAAHRRHNAIEGGTQSVAAADFSQFGHGGLSVLASVTRAYESAQAMQLRYQGLRVREGAGKALNLAPAWPGYASGKWQAASANF